MALLFTTILFGLAPAIAATRPGLAAYLKEGGRTAGEGIHRGRFNAALVVVQVALTLLLGIGAALTLRSLLRMQAVNPGFNPEGLLTANLLLPRASYSDPGQRANFFRTLVERLAAAPGVKAAGLVSDLPFGGSKSGNDVVIEGAPAPRSGDRLIAFYRTVDAGYFPAMQVRLLRGRLFNPRDVCGPPVGVINETMARRCWPGEDPVGRRFATGSESGRKSPVVHGGWSDCRHAEHVALRRSRHRVLLSACVQP